MRSQKVTRRRKSGGVDRINDLSDDILCQIISFLNIKEAIITGVISTRWQHLWKYSSKLDLPRYMIMRDGTEQLFQDRVNGILDQHLGSELSELRISYSGSSGLDGSIDRWISFALAKKVTTLALCMNMTTFPSFDVQQSCLENVYFSGVRINGCSLQIFRCLKYFKLSCTKLNGSDLDRIISTCSSLEALGLTYVSGLRYANIVGPSLKLKWLSINNTPLERIEISAPELKTLCFSGPKTSICFTNCSKLVELFVRLDGGSRMADFLMLFENVLFQIETLEMAIFPHEVKFVQLPTFPNLKTLRLEVYSIKVKHIAFASLLKASPSLRLLTLQLDQRPRLRDHPEEHNEAIKIEDDSLEWSHTCLEKIYIDGYNGYKYENELLYYLLKTCTSLKKVTLDARNFYTNLFTGSLERSENGMRRTYRARQFAKHVEQPSVNFVVL